MKNPQAFPSTESVYYTRFNPGMALRDYFAAKAMNGILAANPKETWGNIELPVPDYVSKLSFEFADAMLKAREL